MTYDEQAIAAHREWRGKVDYASKVTVRNHDDLSIVYTPGVAAPCMEIHRHPELVRDFTAVGNLVAAMLDGGGDGIDIDFEGLELDNRDDLVDFIVGRICDQLEIENNCITRWGNH